MCIAPNKRGIQIKKKKSCKKNTNTVLVERKEMLFFLSCACRSHSNVGVIRVC